MPNKLTFHSLYKSIVDFPTIELPEFVVLTGCNGSGKTHLLEAIQESHVTSSLVSNKDTDVRLYDWNTIVPSDTGVFDPAQIQSLRSQWFTFIRRARDKVEPQLKQFAIEQGIPQDMCSSARRIAALGHEDLRQCLPNPDNAVVGA